VALNGQQLTPEQNALVSGCVSLAAVATIVLYSRYASGPVVSSVHVGGGGGAGATPPPVLLAVNTKTAVSLVGGVFHFTAYLVTLMAFSTISR
jgi:hypothetical protein